MAHERISSTAAWADFSITSLKGIAVLLPIAGVILALWLKPVDVNFPELSKENVIGLLTGLIVIALFIERAVEVFLTPWRSTKSLKISKKVKYEKPFLKSKIRTPPHNYRIPKASYWTSRAAPEPSLFLSPLVWA